MSKQFKTLSDPFLWMCLASFRCMASGHPSVIPNDYSPSASLQVPLVVHSTWNESRNEAFPQVLEYRRKWEALGFQVSITGDEAIRDDILAVDQLVPSLDLLTLFDNLATNVMRYDVWRYTKLYLDGGIYADVDIEPLLDGRIVDYVKESQATNRPIVFEESNWPNNMCMRFLVPRLSDYSELPSYGNSVMIAPGPRHAFFLDLLQNLHPDHWQHTPEPRRTLMSTGPGHVTQWIKRQRSSTNVAVVLVGYLDRKGIYVHHGFGTWKFWMPKEFWIAYNITMVLSVLLVGILLLRKCQRRCGSVRRRLSSGKMTLVVYHVVSGGGGKP